MKKKSISVSRWLFYFLILSFFFSPTLLYAKTFIYVNEPYPPWTIFKETNGTVINNGIDIEIMKLIASHLDIEIKIEEYPWKRCLAMLKSGEADICGTVAKKPEREKYLHYIEPSYYRDSRAFYVNKDNSNRLLDYNDLYNLKIGVVSGYKYFPRFDEDSNLMKTRVTSGIQLLKMLESRRIDTFISPEIPADYLITSEGYNNKFTKAPFRYSSGSPGYIVISKKSHLSGYLPQMNLLMKQLVADGKIKAIIDRVKNK